LLQKARSSGHLTARDLALLGRQGRAVADPES
jgi:hypothetical protein